MWVFDLETHRVLAVNGAAITHYGYSREEFLALRIEDLRPAEDIPALHRHLTTMPADYHAAGIWRHRKKDGTLIEVETSGHRSEEHTSELQSRGHLVCRLLLEKKNIRPNQTYNS